MGRFGEFETAVAASFASGPSDILILTPYSAQI